MILHSLHQLAYVTTSKFDNA